MSPDGAADAKSELRARFGAARRAMSDADREAARAAVRSVVLDRCRAQGWRCVAAYVALRTEPGSPQLLDGLTALGVGVLVPVTLPDRDLEWTRWPAGAPSGPGREVTLGKGAVADADAVLVPALAVATSDGTRLGRGGGSYDRALVRRRSDAVVAALLFDGETVSALPAEPWDVPVSDVAAPSGWTTLDRHPRNTGVEPAG